LAPDNPAAHMSLGVALREKGDAEGKVWLEPSMEAVYFRGFTSREQNEIMDITRINLKNFIKKWYEYFPK